MRDMENLARSAAAFLEELTLISEDLEAEPESEVGREIRNLAERVAELEATVDTSIEEMVGWMRLVNQKLDDLARATPIFIPYQTYPPTMPIGAAPLQPWCGPSKITCKANNSCVQN